MQQQLAEFIDFCRVERRLATATCRVYERDVGACLAFLAAEGISDLDAVRVPDLRRDPAAVLRTPKKRSAIPDVLDRRELIRLLNAPLHEDAWEREQHGRRERDRQMLALFAYAGLRRSELLGLDWDDVDLERRLLRVRIAKGGHARVVPIHPALEPLFMDYLRTRG